MNKIDAIIKQAKELEERFLPAETETGLPEEPETIDPKEDQIEGLIGIVTNSVESAQYAINHLLRGNKQALNAMFGEDAEAILGEANAVLEELLSFFGEESEEEEKEETEEEESEESEEETKKEPEEKEEEPKEDEKEKEEPTDAK